MEYNKFTFSVFNFLQADDRVLHDTALQLTKAVKSQKELRDLLCHVETEACEILGIKQTMTPQTCPTQDRAVKLVKQLAVKMKVSLIHSFVCIFFLSAITALLLALLPYA